MDKSLDDKVLDFEERGKLTKKAREANDLNDDVGNIRVQDMTQTDELAKGWLVGIIIPAHDRFGKKHMLLSKKAYRVKRILKNGRVMLKEVSDGGP